MRGGEKRGEELGYWETEIFRGRKSRCWRADGNVACTTTTRQDQSQEATESHPLKTVNTVQNKSAWGARQLAHARPIVCWV